MISVVRQTADRNRGYARGRQSAYQGIVQSSKKCIEVCYNSIIRLKDMVAKSAL